MQLVRENRVQFLTPTTQMEIPELPTDRVIKVGVNGYGYWGSKLGRNCQELAATQVTTVAHRDTRRRPQVSHAYPNIAITSDYHELLRSDVDAVVVATPVSTHFQIALAALEHGKHVLIEKPL